MARAKRPLDVDALVERAVTLVTAHGAVPRAEMKAFRPHLSAIHSRQVARGVEVGSAIRRPLDQQLVELAGQGVVPEKGLERRVAGASAREVKEAVHALIAREVLVRVVRDSGTGLAASPAAVLGPDEIQHLLRSAAALQKLLKKARTEKGRAFSVLREDVRALLATWPRAPEHGPSKANGRTTSSSSELAVEIARRVREARIPTRVPDLLRSMGIPTEAGKQALLDGVSRGLFELEPESGMGRLTREDAELCPAGPMGTRLSWIRICATRTGEQGASS